MGADKLFLFLGSPECGRVRAILSMAAATDEKFKGKAGQELWVFSASDQHAATELLAKFGLEKENMPLMVTHDGQVHRSVKEICLHLKNQGMADRTDTA